MEGASGAGSLGITPITGLTDAATVQAALEKLMDVVSDLAAGVVPDGSITPEKLADGAVTTPKLGALAVTAPKLAAGAVTNEKTDFSAGFAPQGVLVLKSGVHYFASESALPSSARTGQIAFVKV